MAKYKPKSITDLSSAVAYIRPGCASIVSKLVDREHFTFGIKEIDDTLFSHTGIGSYVLYQESILVMLNYAGIDKKDTYTLLKAISKKKEDVIKSAKEAFIEGMIKKIMEGNK